MYFFCWQVVSNGARTPQKDANIVSKAMEYIFGWWMKDLKFSIDIIYFKIISEFAMHVKLGNRCDTIVIGSQTNFRA